MAKWNMAILINKGVTNIDINPTWNWQWNRRWMIPNNINIIKHEPISLGAPSIVLKHQIPSESVSIFDISGNPSKISAFIYWFTWHKCQSLYNYELSIMCCHWHIRCQQCSLWPGFLVKCVITKICTFAHIPLV